MPKLNFPPFVKKNCNFDTNEVSKMVKERCFKESKKESWGCIMSVPEGSIGFPDVLKGVSRNPGGPGDSSRSWGCLSGFHEVSGAPGGLMAVSGAFQRIKGAIRGYQGISDGFQGDSRDLRDVPGFPLEFQEGSSKSQLNFRGTQGLPGGFRMSQEH